MMVFSFRDNSHLLLSGKWGTQDLESLQRSRRHRVWHVSKRSRSPCASQTILSSLLVSNFPAPSPPAQHPAFSVHPPSSPTRESPQNCVHLPEPLTCLPPQSLQADIFFYFSLLFQFSVQIYLVHGYWKSEALMFAFSGTL